MKAVILDTSNGERFNYRRDNIRSFEWAENGWSCDCNRGRTCEDGSTECECKRFLVVEAEFNSNDYIYTLAELNSGYPEELLKKHGIIGNNK